MVDVKGWWGVKRVVGSRGGVIRDGGGMGGGSQGMGWWGSRDGRGLGWSQGVGW